MMDRTSVVAYLRVSTEAQADGGVSLSAQVAKVSAYADLYELDIVAFIEDAGVSAKTLARPGLEKALALLKSQVAQGILVAKLDRLTRSVRDLGTLLDHYFSGDFALLSVAEQVDTRTAAGRLVLNVLTSVAQWERETRGERTRDALAHLKAEGVRLGGAALGWRRTGERDEEGRLLVETVAAEARSVDRLLELNEQGFSYRQIARKLEAEGLRTKRGGRWHHQTVARVVRRATA